MNVNRDHQRLLYGRCAPKAGANGNAGGYARRTSRRIGNQIKSLGTRLNADSEGGKDVVG